VSEPDRLDGRTERARHLREERRRQILDAALRVFAEKGYHGTSIADVVDAAGVARGTFYLYFEGKNQIFVELLDELLATFRASVRGIDPSPAAAPLVDQVVASVVRILEVASSSRALATVLFREALVLDDESGGRVLAFEQQLLAWIAGSLANGVRLGLLRAHDTDVVATVIYGSIRQVIHRFVVVDGERFDREHVARELVMHHLMGLLAREDV
jgi:AcrR family transcriptional regulator